MSTVVKDVMTTHVISVDRDTPFAAIVAALRQYHVSAFPVVDEKDQVIGVVSESDLLNKMALGGGEDHMITGILRHKQLEKARGVTASRGTTSCSGSGTSRVSSRSATASTTRRQARTPSTCWPGSLSTENHSTAAGERAVASACGAR